MRVERIYVFMNIKCDMTEKEYAAWICKMIMDELEERTGKRWPPRITVKEGLTNEINLVG